MLKALAVTQENVALLGAVHARAWCAIHGGIADEGYYRAFTPDRQAALFRRAIAAGTERPYLLWDEDTVVGMFSLGPEGGEGEPGLLDKLYLLPEFCGRGYGRQAMDLAVRLLDRSEVILWVIKDNLRARRFYERYGYEYDDVTQPVAPGAPVEEMRYRLRCKENERNRGDGEE